MNCTAIPSFEIAFPFPALPSSTLCVICSRRAKSKEVSLCLHARDPLTTKGWKVAEYEFCISFSECSFLMRDLCADCDKPAEAADTHSERGCASEGREMWRCVLLKATAELKPWHEITPRPRQREAEHKAHLCLQRVTHSLPTRSFNLYNNHYSQPSSGTTQIICCFCAGICYYETPPLLLY